MLAALAVFLVVWLYMCWLARGFEGSREVY